MNKKETVKRILFFLLAAAVLLFAAFAWFTQNKVADVKPIAIYSADASKVGAQLYHKIGMDGEIEVYEPVTRLVCSNYLPGQTEKYKIVLTNSDSFSYVARVDFLKFFAEDDKNMALCQVMRLEHATADIPLQEGETLCGDGTLAELYTLPTEPENTSFLFANEIKIDAQEGDKDSERSLFFEITLPEQTSNEFQNLQVKLSSIAVQVTPTIN